MNQRVYAVTVRGSEMGINLLHSAIKAVLNRDKTKTFGKQSIKDLNKQGIELSNHEISAVDLKPFEKELRKFGVDYAIQKDPTKKEVYNVYFKARDITQIEKALLSYMEKNILKQEKPPIAEKIKLAVMKVSTQQLTLNREKNREHGAR